MNTQTNAIPEASLIQTLRLQVEALWQAIPKAASFLEQEKIRKQYREAMERYQRQRLMTA